MVVLKNIYNAVIIGLKKSLKLILKLALFIIPVYFIVSILDYTNVLNYIAGFFEPVMVVFGLPGEAALSLILAFFVNIYAALGVIGKITLTVKQITILGCMIGCAHTLLIETTVIKTLNVPRYLQIIIRISAALLIGMLINLVWR